MLLMQTKKAIRKVPGGKYLPWYFDIQAKGRARKRAARPKRDILSIRNALNNLKLHYWQEVSFWNPLHTGKHDDLDGGLQWVDFVVKGKIVPFVILHDDPQKRKKEYEKRYLQTKEKGLDARGYLILKLPAGKTSQEYQVTIYMFIRRNKL